MTDAAPVDITIGPANDDDREWCAHLMASSEPWLTLGRTIDQTRPLFYRKDSELHIARHKGAPCGFLLLRDRGIVYSPYIASLAVSPEARGQKIGSRLLDFVEERARPVSKHIFLCVSSFNTRARALYERQGYTVVGELKDYVVDGLSEYLMSKRLR